MAFDKNQELLEGYKQWWVTDPKDPDYEDKVGKLLALDVNVIGEDGAQLADNKGDALEALKTLRVSTEMDPDSVEVFTNADRTTSIVSDEEHMTGPTHRRFGSHTCFDKLEWKDTEDGPKIAVIYVCIADSVH